jgi:hypothetical protein
MRPRHTGAYSLAPLTSQPQNYVYKSGHSQTVAAFPLIEEFRVTELNV